VCLPGAAVGGQAERLATAGAYAYSHNLNTSEERYADICSTHTFADRADTVRRASRAGLSPCSGAIFGMGESDQDIVDLALALRELDPDSVPVNFLIPFKGTPLGDRWDPDPRAMPANLGTVPVFPDVEVRLAGGREIHLRGLQSLALHLANSMFLGDYLTSEGQPGTDDRELIADAGFVIKGLDERTLPAARPPTRLGQRPQIPACAEISDLPHLDGEGWPRDGVRHSAPLRSHESPGQPFASWLRPNQEGEAIGSPWPVGEPDLQVGDTPVLESKDRARGPQVANLQPF
jgi:hypothetical protein